MLSKKSCRPRRHCHDLMCMLRRQMCLFTEAIFHSFKRFRGRWAWATNDSATPGHSVIRVNSLFSFGRLNDFSFGENSITWQNRLLTSSISPKWSIVDVRNTMWTVGPEPSWIYTVSSALSEHLPNTTITKQSKDCAKFLWHSANKWCLKSEMKWKPRPTVL